MSVYCDTAEVRRTHVSLGAVLVKSKDFRRVWKTVTGQLSSSYRLDCWLGAINAIPKETRAAEH